MLPSMLVLGNRNSDELLFLTYCICFGKKIENALKVEIYR